MNGNIQDRIRVLINNLVPYFLDNRYAKTVYKTPILQGGLGVSEYKHCYDYELRASGPSVEWGEQRRWVG